MVIKIVPPLLVYFLIDTMGHKRFDLFKKSCPSLEFWRPRVYWRRKYNRRIRQEIIFEIMSIFPAFLQNSSWSLNILKSRLTNHNWAAGTLEWDTFNPDCLIRISNVDTFNFLLNPLFFGYSTEKSKTGFSKLESPSHFLVVILNGAQNF